METILRPLHQKPFFQLDRPILVATIQLGVVIEVAVGQENRVALHRLLAPDDIQLRDSKRRVRDEVLTPLCKVRYVGSERSDYGCVVS